MTESKQNNSSNLEQHYFLVEIIPFASWLASHCDGERQEINQCFPHLLHQPLANISTQNISISLTFGLAFSLYILVPPLLTYHMLKIFRVHDYDQLDQY